MGRRERKAERMKLGGGNPPDRMTPWTRNDPLVVWAPDGSRCDAGLRNLWRGCPAFLVGGGPSLAVVDLALLQQRGVLSLGVNNAAGHVPCSAFVCGDPVLKFAECVWRDPKILKFIPRGQLGSRLRVKRGDKFWWSDQCPTDCPSVFGIDRGGEFVPANFFTTTAACWGAKGGDPRWPKIRFTLFMGFRLLHFLGCSEVYLLGVDFAQEGPLKYAFEQDDRGRAHHGGGTGHWRKARPMLAAIDWTGMPVFDCGPRSQLGVFPKLDYREAIGRCVSQVGPLPPDLTGWYSRHV